MQNEECEMKNLSLHNDSLAQSPASSLARMRHTVVWHLSFFIFHPSFCILHFAFFTPSS
jgi:hypothetical protein